MRPLRIAFFLRAFPVLSETFIVRQAAGLLERGHDVRIFSENSPATEDPVHSVVERQALLERVTYLPMGRDGTARGTLAVLRRAIRRPRAFLPLLRKEAAADYGGRRRVVSRAAALAGEEPFDVVHCHFGPLGRRWAFAAGLWDAPLVTSFYGFDCSRYPRERGSDVYRSLFARSDRVVALSEHMEARLAELGCPRERIVRVPLCVDVGRFPFRERRPPERGNPVNVLTVARLVEKKGLEHALRAVADVIGRGHALRYEILGDGPLRPSLEGLVEELGIARDVRFRGAVDHERVRAAMAGAHLFLLPSVTAADGDEEGTPTVLIEASASGLPILATRHAGIPEIVIDGVTGTLVPERDREALAAALEDLLGDPGRWAAMGRVGRERAESTFAAGRVIDRLEGLYGLLLAEAAEGASVSS